MATVRPFIKYWSFKLLLVAALAASLLLGGISTSQTAQAHAEQRLTLTNIVSPNPAMVGQQLTFTLTVTNTAPTPNTLIEPMVMDTLPPGMTVDSVTPGPGATPPFCNQDSGTVTCTFDRLDNGESATATIVAIPTQCGPFTNIARGNFDAGTVPADFTVQGCPPVPPETTAPLTGPGEGTDGTKLPGSGGSGVASLLLPASALLMGSAIVAYALLRRRR